MDVDASVTTSGTLEGHGSPCIVRKLTLAMLPEVLLLTASCYQVPLFRDAPCRDGGYAVSGKD